MTAICVSFPAAAGASRRCGLEECREFELAKHPPVYLKRERFSRGRFSSVSHELYVRRVQPCASSAYSRRTEKAETSRRVLISSSLSGRSSNAVVLLTYAFIAVRQEKKSRVI